jgi:endonuclease YncB( thermonuclease family)
MLLPRCVRQPWVCLAACAALLALPAGGVHGQARTLTLRAPVAVVHDGDTFDADLDGDGRVEPPRERVRLLYVDTPELHESWKGQDLAHGLPAKAFLERLLARAPVVLTVLPGNAEDRYGRTLARVWAGGADVSLELVRAGHSYFDTRFALPPDYEDFAQAEGRAFSARLGIWGDAASRGRYLERLRREHKTPRAADNALFLPGVWPAQGLDARGALGRYVIVTGTLAARWPLRNGHWALRLEGGGSQPPLAVFVLGQRAGLLGVERWPLRGALRAEGFVREYRGAPELLLHYGRPGER